MATLSDLQTEREKLRALAARTDYETALGETVSHKDVLDQAAGLRRLVAQTMSVMPGLLAQAIDGERDETRVHYLMADMAHTVLTDMGAQAEITITTLPKASTQFKRGVQPRDLLTVSQWADRNRWLRSGTNAPGRWDTALTPYLREVMDSLSEHSPVRTVVLKKSTGVGGPLALDTPILTTSGWTTMGDITVGATVFDERGQPCQVQSVSEIFHGRPCFEVVFSDGAVIRCDASHLWTVTDRFPGHLGKKRGVHRQTRTLTTAQIAATFLASGRRRYGIEVTEPLELPEADLPIPPYVLGYWLANGNTAANQLTCHIDDAKEIAAHIRTAGWPATVRHPEHLKGAAANIWLRRPAWPDGLCLRGHVLAEVGIHVNTAGARVCMECQRQHSMHHQYGRAVDPVIRPDGFMTRLRSIGIENGKHIPRSYLQASAAQRLELLRGLMDGDGSIDVAGRRCEFSTASEEIANNVLELLCGLGFKPALYRVKKRGYAALKKTPTGPHYRISFKAYAEFSVFHLARKRHLLTQRADGHPTIVSQRNIVDVRPVDSFPVRCIGVNSPNHLFLCGRELIATHNSEVMMNWVGYTMQHLQNKDMLVVLPTLELRDRSFNPRMAKMLDESEALHGLVTKSTRDKANRAEVVEYGAHARIIRAGANSPDSLRSDHLPYVICDEVSAYPWDVGGEGDPMTLIENRQRTYSRAKSYFISTPTTAGRCRISQQYERSDQRHYHVPCPHCGTLQVLEFDRAGTADHGLKWHATAPVDKETGEVLPQHVLSAWYVCKHCHGEIQEASKTEMLAHGKWIPHRPSVKRVRGYHINALYAPVGLGTSWRDIAQKWLDSQGDTSELKAFVNTYLGETWSEQGDSIEDISLISRLEPYEPHGLPYRLITGGVDVQKNRLEASVVGWGEKEEAWLIDHLIVPGDTAQAEVWAEMGEALAHHHVRVAAIDAGYNTSAVYAFCSGKRWAIPVKGIGGPGRPLIEDERKRAARLRRRVRRQHAAEPLGVDQGKALIYARLKMEKPGPGYIHFPREPAFDDEYFAQLAAEKLVTKVRGTRPFQEWVQLRPRNEALDCLVYNFAAMRLSRVNLDGPAPEQPAAPDTPKPTARPARRRVVSRALTR